MTLEGTIASVREDLLKGRLGEQGVCGWVGGGSWGEGGVRVGGSGVRSKG